MKIEKPKVACVAERAEVAPKPKQGCWRDTDGDGDCPVCVRRPGGCINPGQRL